MELTGKVVVVTGGASGIGRALARRFADEGARGVAVADIDADGARAVADQIGADGGEATAAGCDVSDARQVEDLIAGAERAFGPVDMFCANAGVGQGTGLRSDRRRTRSPSTRPWHSRNGSRSRSGAAGSG